MLPASSSDTGAADDRAGDARVAILMRTRDRPILLARALAGVLAQRHADWHLLLVNDGGDPGIVDRLVAQHETGFAGRVTVRHLSGGGGMEAASNAALALSDAQGSFGFVAVHDDDDSWHPAFLQRAVGWLRAPQHGDFAAVMTHWTVVHEQLDQSGVLERSRERAAFDWPAVRYDALLGRNRFPPICLLLRRSTVARAGAFDAGMPVLGDWDYVLRVLALGDIGVLPEPLAFYHRRDAGTLPDYLNSGQDATTRHDLQAILYRNAGLRALARTGPAALSVLGALGVQAELNHEQAEQQRGRVLANLDRNGLWGHARHEDLQQRLVRVEESLARIEAALSGQDARDVPPGSPPVPPPSPSPSPSPAALRLAGRLLRRLAPGLAPALIDRMRRRSA